MLFLVQAMDGPGFGSPEEAAEVLEAGVLPLFDALKKLEKDGVIVAGGLPVASRTFIFMLKADSNDEADQILRDLPGWGVFHWDVTALQSISGRAKMERKNLASLRGE